MTEWFKDDKELEDSLKGDDSIFTDDLTFEFDESNEPSEEDVQLAELGIRIKDAELYRKSHPNKNIFYGDKLTKQFFEWYLGMCDAEQLKEIKREKLDQKLQEMLDNAKPHSLGKELPDSKQDLIELASLAGKRKQYLKFLYDLMPKLMKDEYEFNETEIEMIAKIKEDLQ